MVTHVFEKRQVASVDEAMREKLLILLRTSGTDLVTLSELKSLARTSSSFCFGHYDCSHVSGSRMYSAHRATAIASKNAVSAGVFALHTLVNCPCFQKWPEKPLFFSTN
jgi:hypothetical protein